MGCRTGSPRSRFPVNGPETKVNAVIRTGAFNSLLGRLKRDRITVLVYSRAFISEREFRKKFLPKHLDDHYGSRAEFLPYISNVLMSENPEGQEEFRKAFSSLLNDDSAWPEQQ